MTDTRSNARRSNQDSAHRRSVTVDSSDRLASLMDKLGPKMTAFMVEKDVSTVTRWAKSGVPQRDDDALKRLLLAYQVLVMLEEHEAVPTIRAWFLGMNPQLDDSSPAEAVQEGRHREVLAAARAFIAGG